MLSVSIANERLRRSLRWPSDALTDLGIFLVLSIIALGAGFGGVGATQYRSYTQVFADFMNSPLRLLFPVAIALSAGLKPANELSHRFVVSTRARQYILRRVAGWFIGAVLRSFVIFAAITVVCGVCSFVVVPALHLASVDPASYGLPNSAAVLQLDRAQAPLAWLLQFGWPVFVAGVSVWCGLHAALFSVVTVIAVILIRRTVLALMVPLALYLAESVIAQVLGMPGVSFLVSALYPSGLDNYGFGEASLPSLGLALFAVGCAIFLIFTSRSSSRFS